jgi:2-oxo-4-hydroxy-4-carboxy-5-ureidoimidazoline decarboxylase
MHTLDQLNTMPTDAFVAALDGVFEHAAWVAHAAAPHRPFATVTALHEALMAEVHAAPSDVCLAFLCGHPALSPQALAGPTQTALPLAAAALPAPSVAVAPLAGQPLTAASRSEQGSLGITSLGDDLARFEAASSAYEARFGFPFIVCVRRQTPPFVLRGIERRLANTSEQERAAALTEIGHITRLRLVERVVGAGMPRTAGHLSAHVLDTARGRPAEGIRIELFRENVLIVQAITNKDGRSDAPLLEDAPLRIGRYELRFHVEDYFNGWPNVTDPPWYDVIPIRFAIADPEGDYHIPLLLGAWTYTTYRGS